MKEQILTHLDDPKQLEKLYREDRSAFKQSFNALYPEVAGNPLSTFWNERLNFPKDDIFWGSGKDLAFVIIASLIAGLIAKVPAFVPIDVDFYYPRNIGFIIFPVLAAFFAWKNGLSAGKIGFIGATMLAGLIFINSLPNVETSNTLILSCIHLVLFLWCILGFAFVGEFRNVPDKRLGFLKYNGDLVVMTTLIVIAGGIMTGITIGLFAVIGIKIEEFWFDNIVVFGLPGAPILGTYLTRTNPNLVGKVSPVIAKIFSPLVLVMLVIYLGAMLYSGKDPYNDREFLLIFNALLIGVMAIIFFSVAENSREKSQTENWILFLLSAVTIIVNGIALSAIIFRIAEWGITPNRAAVLGGNALILINLVLVTVQLFRAVTRKTEIGAVGRAIAWFLPVYFFWTIIVTFLFPVIFNFK